MLGLEVFPVDPIQGQVLLASSGQRAGMLLSTLRCARQPPTTQSYLPQDVTIAEAENPAIGKPEPPCTFYQ